MTTRPEHKWSLTTPVFDIPPEEVDVERGILRGVAIVTEGEAQGHCISLDAEFVEDTIRHGNKRKSGLKVRFGHPNMSSTALGTFLGRAKSFRLDEVRGAAVARADVYLSNEAKETPNGDLHSYVMGMADNEADMLGMSIVFTEGSPFQKAGPDGKVDKDSPWYARLEKLHAADLVDDPAANPDGLFTASAWSRDTFASQVTEFLDTHPEIFAVVEKNPDVIGDFMARYQTYLKRKGPAMVEPEETVSLEDMLAAEATDKKKAADDEAKATADAEAAAAADGDAEPAEPAEAAEPDPATGDAAPATEDAEPDPALAADPGRTECRRFVKAYGPQGGQWYADGLTFEQATQKNTEAQNQRIEELENKLQSVDRGETEALAADDAEPEKPAQRGTTAAERRKPQGTAGVLADINTAKAQKAGS